MADDGEVLTPARVSPGDAADIDNELANAATGPVSGIDSNSPVANAKDD